MIAEPDDNLVAIGDACPNCGERHVDNLIWIDDGERVRCARCATVYTPPALRREGGDEHAQQP